MTKSAQGCGARLLKPAIPMVALLVASAGQAGMEKRAATIETVAERSDADPIINLRVLFRAGSRDDPAGQEGITALSAKLMTEATRSHDAGRLKDELFPWAAETGVQVDKETVVFTGRVHRDFALRFYGLFLQTLQAPRLDPADFERLRDAQLNSIERRLRTSSDENLVREALEVELYDTAWAPAPGADGNTAEAKARHPYRHTPSGTVEGLKRLTLEDIKVHIRRTLTRDRVVLGISGGFDPEHLDLLQGALAALPLPEGPRAALPPAPPIEATTVTIIDKKDAPGTPISLGFHVELDRTHPDYPAMKIAETYFGEHRNRVGLLFNNMREVRGLNYGDYAYVEHFVQQGWSTLEQLNIGREQQYFSIWIRPVEHKNRHFALRQAVFELDRLVKQGVPNDAKLDEIKKFVRGYWRSKEQEPMRRLGYVLDDAWNQTPGARDELINRVDAVTLDQVNAAIARHLRADRLRIVVVTQDGATFKKALLDNAASPIVYPAPKPTAVTDEDKLIGAVDLQLTADRVRVVEPATFFER